MVIRALGVLFFILMALALVQCGRMGSPSGGPKDVTPPVLINAEPPNRSINFTATSFRLEFDEFVKLKDIQNQLIVSPPLKYPPIITPQGNANKFVEVKIKDTLRPNTTYTFNFGQSIEDNNEGNPNRFLTYVFSTGAYLDSLSLSGVVTDAFNEKADTFISVMLYEMDSTYTDSTIYLQPPSYMTNTLDSTTFFQLNNLKAGRYALMALKDEGKNNMFDQNTDKIGFVTDTIVLPTDSVYGLNLFREVPDYSAAVPSMASGNRIIFGYTGAKASDLELNLLSTLPDSVKTTVNKDVEKDTLNFWFSPLEADSLVFTLNNTVEQVLDTFIIKTRKLDSDSLNLRPNQSSSLDMMAPFFIQANTPLAALETDSIQLMNLNDSTQMDVKVSLDTLNNRLDVALGKEPNMAYGLTLLPGTLTDFFGQANDTIDYRLSTASLADFGNLRLNLAGNISYPLILQLTNEKGETQRELFASEGNTFEFNLIKPGNYKIRLIQDANGNQKWDTGSFLEKRQPESVLYYPKTLEIRANWDLEETYTLY